MHLDWNSQQSTRVSLSRLLALVYFYSQAIEIAPYFRSRSYQASVLGEIYNQFLLARWQRVLLAPCPVVSSVT